jgi:type VI secretion system secreted protein VgrG
MVRVAFLVLVAGLLGVPFQGLAGTISLGSAQAFAVLGASTVTNTGNTTITGDVGLYAGTSFTPGSGTFTLNGTEHITDAAAQLAENALTAAYTSSANLTPTTILTGVDLNGLVLAPGVYFFATSAQLTGKLTLDFGTTPNADFVFQIGSTLTTASGSSIVVDNAGAGSGIYFQVGSSATLGTTTAFQGNILAQDSITINNSATIECGRALARTGAVTMDTNTISDTCPAANGSYGYSGASSNTGVPEPGTLTLLSMGLGAGFLLFRRFRPRLR